MKEGSCKRAENKRKYLLSHYLLFNNLVGPKLNSYHLIVLRVFVIEMVIQIISKIPYQQSGIKVVGSWCGADFPSYNRPHLMKFCIRV